MIDKPIKILAVEDNDFDFELVERRLKSFTFPFTIKRAFTEEDFRASLSQFAPDLILSDFSIPAFSGLEALKIARQSHPDVPFIFVSGTIGEELAVETLKQGAIDYVLKENLNKLEHSIKRALDETKERERRKQAEAQLEIKVNELKTLVYRISHDIRSPICSIKGILNLIKDSEAQNPEDFNNYVNLIDQVVGKMEGIILNLSSFQHVYADEITVDSINLKDFESTLMNKVSEIADFKDVDFKLSSKGSGMTFGELNLLMTICYNLIHNSIVFSDKNKDSKAVNCFMESLENGFHFVVEDNGVGIPEFIHDKIFDMFFRGSTASKGAGLGLFITKAILQRLNGEIRIESEENVGTKISVSIPAQKKINMLAGN